MTGNGRNREKGPGSTQSSWCAPRESVRLHLLLGTLFLFQALSKAQLKHAVALWQFLSARKSEQLLRLKKVSLPCRCPDEGASSQALMLYLFIFSRIPFGISVLGSKQTSAQKVLSSSAPS